MNRIRFYSGEEIPVEMHKVRIVQKLSLLSVKERLKAVQDAGSNTFLLKNRDVYLDMLTDSGVNAMSDRQLAAMMEADDSYAGSETFARLEAKCTELFGTKYFLPAHQGRACEHILAKVFVKPGTIVPMNYHFTTTKAHIVLCGGSVVETPIDEAYRISSAYPFKGNMDIDKLRQVVEEHGASRIAFVRMEAGTNLIGGQPFSLDNLAEVKSLCGKHGIPLILDASLLADNLYFIKVREEKYRDWSIREIARRIADLCDIIYFSGRKLGCARGGGMMTSNAEYFKQIREFIPLYEGFLTYGGMSVREMEAIAVGLEETMELEMISHGPQFIAYMAEELIKRGIPVVTPPGGLGCHLDAREFLDHLPQEEYPAGALAAAVYIASGARGMERGTMSEQREPDGSERLADMELLRLALPRRVFTLSQVKYVVDRVSWLYENRRLVGGLKFVEEPETLRFFFGRLAPLSDWQEQLADKYMADLGEY
ncbi:MAG: tryptophanase [Limnochordia bacterium]|jgi:tyrosine phenol-lyase|nr:tryptophanase [Bacillota bacterium]NLH32062.1 tryptophanase [Bacillota bacterium]HOB09296.1 tryptophanase [Limnochordia bacterium]HPZ31514.1 tryptophanase [Limnochordia bacterium]HQD71374.1 tryptophanase [Limnochordia bacterium]